MSVNVASRPRRTRSPRPSATSGSAAGFGQTLSRLVRHGDRRPPRRDAAALPAAGGAARAGRAAQGGLRHRHARRRHQRADPHGRVHRAVEVRRRPRSGTSRCASSTRSPAAPAGPGSTPPAPSSSRRRTTRWRTSGCSPGPGTTRRRRSGSSGRSRRRGSSPGAGRRSSGWRTAEPEPLTSQLPVTPRDGAQRHRPARRRVHRDAAPARGQPRGPRRAQLRHIKRAIAIYRALLAGGVVERLDEPDATGRTVRLTVDLQPDFALNQPLSPFALAALERARPRVAVVRAGRRLGHRVDARRPAAGARRRSSSRRAARPWRR